MAIQAALLEMKQQANRVIIALEIAKTHDILNIPSMKLVRNSTNLLGKSSGQKPLDFS